MRPRERGGGLRSDQSRADDGDSSARICEATGERGETFTRSVLLGLVEARDGRLRIAQAGRPHERRRFDLERRAVGRDPDRQTTAVEVALGHESVDVLDPSLCELRGIGEHRHATRQERAFGERRPIVGQSRPDHGDGHAALGEPRCAGIPGNAVADDHDLSAHGRIRAGPEIGSVRRRTVHIPENPQSSSRERLPAVFAGNPHPRCAAVRIPRAPCRGIIPNDRVRRTNTDAASGSESEGTTMVSSERPDSSVPSRRSLFALAAALALTVLTGVVAVAGLARRVPATPTAPRVGQVLTPAAPAPPPRVEPGG